jgi:hypothetical protein
MCAAAWHQVYLRGNAGGVAAGVAAEVAALVEGLMEDHPGLGNDKRPVLMVLDKEFHNQGKGEHKSVHSIALACGLTGRVWRNWRVRPTKAGAWPPHPSGVDPVTLEEVRGVLLELHRQLLAAGCELVLVGWGQDDWAALTAELPGELVELWQVPFVDLSYHPQLLSMDATGQITSQPMSLDTAMQHFTGMSCKRWREVKAYNRKHSAVVDVIYTAFVLRCLIRDHQVMARLVGAIAAQPAA